MLYPARTLSGPLNVSLVKPNVDTLYISAVVDLSHEDLVLTVPNISDGRYWSFAWYDL